MKRKLTALLLTLCMTLTLFPGVALAAEKRTITVTGGSADPAEAVSGDTVYLIVDETEIPDGQEFEYWDVSYVNELGETEYLDVTLGFYDDGTVDYSFTMPDADVIAVAEYDDILADITAEVLIEDGISTVVVPEPETDAPFITDEAVDETPPVLTIDAFHEFAEEVTEATVTIPASTIESFVFATDENDKQTHPTVYISTNAGDIELPAIALQTAYEMGGDVLLGIALQGDDIPDKFKENAPEEAIPANFKSRVDVTFTADGKVVNIPEFIGEEYNPDTIWFHVAFDAEGRDLKNLHHFSDDGTRYHGGVTAWYHTITEKMVGFELYHTSSVIFEVSTDLNIDVAEPENSILEVQIPELTEPLVTKEATDGVAPFITISAYAYSNNIEKVQITIPEATVDTIANAVDKYGEKTNPILVMYTDTADIEIPAAILQAAAEKDGDVQLTISVSDTIPDAMKNYAFAANANVKPENFKYLVNADFLVNGQPVFTEEAPAPEDFYFSILFEGKKVKALHRFDEAGTEYYGKITNFTPNTEDFTIVQFGFAHSFTVVFEVVETTSTSGGGGGGSATLFDIDVNNPDNGTVSITPSSQRAASGTYVTITVKPDDGYVVDEVTVVRSSNDDDIDVKEVTKDAKYTFTMPGGDVDVTVTFIEEEEAKAKEEVKEKEKTDEEEEEGTVDKEPIWNFIDVQPTDWYYTAVYAVWQAGLMNGTSDFTFTPDATLTRAMVAQILYNAEGQPEVYTSAGFADVAAGDWYADAVNWAAANGIVSGYGNGLFGANDPVSREQLVTILFRYARYQGMMAVTAQESLGGFVDQAEISEYAITALNWAVGEGIISGMTETTLSPQAPVTRAQAASMLMRFFDL